MVSIETGTLILAIATFFGAFIGSVTQFLVKLFNRRQQRNALRVALAGELKSYGELNDETYVDLSAFEDIDGFLPTPVYSGNVKEIGHLSSDEVNNITKFYTGLVRFQRLLENSDGSLSEAEKETFNQLTTDLEKARQRAIEELEKSDGIPVNIITD